MTSPLPTLVTALVLASVTALLAGDPGRPSTAASTTTAVSPPAPPATASTGREDPFSAAVRATAVGRGSTTQPGAPVAPGARWSFPLTPRPAVVRPFSAPPGPYAAGHRGVDLASAAGEVVGSPTAGTVTFSGAVAGRHVVVIEHAGGLRSTLEPVTGSVAVGTRVERGGAVGTVDPRPGHCHPATCVHWGVLRGTTYLDPLRFVAAPRVVLLPLEP